MYIFKKTTFKCNKIFLFVAIFIIDKTGIAIRWFAKRDHTWAQKIIVRFYPEHLFHLTTIQARRSAIRKPSSLLKNWNPNRPNECMHLERLNSQEQVLDANYDDFFSVSKAVIKPFNCQVLMALHNSAPYDFAGYWYRTHSILQCLSKAGVNVHCATRPGYPWDLQKHRSLPIKHSERIGTVKFFRLSSENSPYKQGSDFSYISNYAAQLASLANQNRSNVVHGHSNYLNGFAAIEASRITGCLSVYEARGFWHLTRLSKEPAFGYTDAYLYEEKMERLALQHANQVVTLSGAMKQLIVSWGIEAEKVHIVPNAVDTSRFIPEEPDLALRQQWSVDGYIVGFIGSITPYEGLLDLVNAVKFLRKQGTEVSLVIAGSGPYEPNLSHSIKGCDFIHYAGRISHKDVRRWYATFDCCAYPRGNDPVCRYVPPLKVLEAMAMEKPVIVSDLPPLLEMVEDRVTGLVCAPNNPESLAEKIRLLTSNTGLGSQLGKQARIWVKANRTWEINAAKYMDVYQGKTAS